MGVVSLGFGVSLEGGLDTDYTCCGEPNMRLERGLVRDGLFLSGVSVWV